MKTQNLFRLFAIVAILILLFLSVKNCTSPKADKPQIHADTFSQITEYYNYKTDTVFKEKIVYRTLKDTLLLPVFVDTSKVINDYYRLKVLQRTFYNSDSMVKVTLQDTLYKNNLKGANPIIQSWSKTLYKEMVITKYTDKPKWYLGGLVALQAKNTSLGLSISKAQPKRLYSLGLGLNGSGSLFVMANYGVLISK